MIGPVAAAMWILTVLVAMVGMGRIVSRLAGTADAKVGWGLESVWGMALFIFLGGFFGALKSCTETTIVLLVLGGAGVFLWDTFFALKSARTRLPPASYGVVIMAIVGVYTFVCGIAMHPVVNSCDDSVAYITFVEKLLVTGGVEEPFSWRRLASLGGNTLLQASIVAATSYRSIQAFELAVAPIILLGLIVGFRGGVLQRSVLGVAIAIVALTTPLLRVNCTSHFTGLVLLFGLFVTLDMLEVSPKSTRLWWVAGLVAAAACTMKAQFIPVAGLVLGLFWLAHWKQQNCSALISVQAGTRWMIALLVGLLPWMIQSYASNESPLYPLFQGGGSRGFNPQSISAGALERVLQASRLLFTAQITPLIICCVSWLSLRSSSGSTALSLASVAGAIMLALSVTLAPDELTVPRYVQPMLLAGAFAAIIARAASGKRPFVAWCSLLALVSAGLPERIEMLDEQISSIRRYERLNIGYKAGDEIAHRDAQKRVPSGKRILVCSDFPFLFDHARNEIWNIDMPHGASPGRALPFQRPAEETKQYLRSLGIDYVIYRAFEKSSPLYSSDTWIANSSGKVLLYRIQAPYYLDFFKTMTALSTVESSVATEGYLSVIRLEP